LAVFDACSATLKRRRAATRRSSVRPEPPAATLARALELLVWLSTLRAGYISKSATKFGGDAAKLAKVRGHRVDIRHAGEIRH
jgi:hypothetical protein